MKHATPTAAETTPIPVTLDTPAFREAWKAWIDERSDRRKPLTARAAEMALRRCEAWGPDAAIAAIEHSIAAGYQGIFPAPVQRTGNTPAAPRPESRTALEFRLRGLRERLRDIKRPGGVAYDVELHGDKLAQAQGLAAEIDQVKRLITAHDNQEGNL